MRPLDSLLSKVGTLPGPPVTREGVGPDSVAYHLEYQTPGRTPFRHRPGVRRTCVVLVTDVEKHMQREWRTQELTEG